MQQHKATRILKNWESFNKEISKLSYDDLSELLVFEEANLNRYSYLKRILIRQNKLYGIKRIQDYFKYL